MNACRSVFERAIIALPNGLYDSRAGAPFETTMRNQASEKTWQFGNLHLSLKEASEKDTDFCRRLHHDAYRDVVIRQFGSWDESLQDDFFLKAWNPSTHAVIHVDEQPAGCLCRIVLPDHIWIAEIQLLPTFQGRGIGTEILKQLMNEAAHSAISVRLQVLKANDRALTLYRRLGFRVTSESETHFQMQWQ